MQQLAAMLGTFVGYAIGHTLRIAGPELRAFISGAIRDALTSTGETGKANPDFQRGVTAADDPLGLFSVGHKDNPDRAGNGGQNEQAHSD